MRSVEHNRAKGPLAVVPFPSGCGGATAFHTMEWASVAGYWPLEPRRQLA